MSNKMEWISVKDGLPREKQQVWTYFEDMAFAVFYDGKFYEGCLNTEHEYTENVTHWMPLPLPPVSEISDSFSLDHIADIGKKETKGRIKSKNCYSNKTENDKLPDCR